MCMNNIYKEEEEKQCIEKGCLTPVTNSSLDIRIVMLQSIVHEHKRSRKITRIMREKEESTFSLANESNTYTH